MATTIDEYLALLTDDQRAALERIRALVHSEVAGAEECIAYGLPTIRKGGTLVAFGAWAHHCAFYPMSDAVTLALADRIAPYASSKGTLRFTPERPLPAALVRAIVRARLRENAEIGLRRTKGRASGRSRTAAPDGKSAARVRRRSGTAARTGAGRIDTPLAELGIGRPATAALTLDGARHLGDLVRYTQRQLLAIHGVGPKAVRIIREALEQAGSGLAVDPGSSV